MTCNVSFYRATACNATHGIALAILSVRMSVFPTSYRWSAYVTPKCLKGGSKSDFFVFLNKSGRLIVSSAVNLVRRSVSQTSDGRLQC